MKNCDEKMIKVGFIQSAHGIRGELFVQLLNSDVDWLDRLEKLLLRKPKSDSVVAFAIESFRPHKNGLIVKIKELVSRTQAEEWRGSDVVLEKEFFASESEEDFYLLELVGFEVLDQGQSVGVVKGFSFNGFQDLLILEQGASVPYVEEWIEEIDFEARQIKVVLPEGLIESQSP